MRRTKNASLGVDLIEASQARSFYRRHARRLGAILAPNELAYVRAGRPAYARLAAILAAKEAAFKAEGGAWMGPAGFRRIKLTRQDGRWHWNGREISFIRHKDCFIAQVANLG